MRGRWFRRIAYPLVVVLGALVVARYASPAPDRDVFDVCRECGLTDEEITRLIEVVGGAGLSRAESLDLFQATFATEGDADLCQPCAEAILKARNRSCR